MDPVTLALVALGGGLLAGGVTLGRRARRRRLAKKEAATSGDERTLDQLELQDVLIHSDGDDYLVQGVVQLDDGTGPWTEALLRDVDREVWIRIPRSPEPFVQWLTRVDPGELPVTRPPSRNIEYQGSVYRLCRRGRSRWTPRGDLGPLAGGGEEVAFWDYRAPGPSRLMLRQVGDNELLVLQGERLARHLVTMLPGH